MTPFLRGKTLKSHIGATNNTSGRRVAYRKDVPPDPWPEQEREKEEQGGLERSTGRSYFIAGQYRGTREKKERANVSNERRNDGQSWDYGRTFAIKKEDATESSSPQVPPAIIGRIKKSPLKQRTNGRRNGRKKLNTFDYTCFGGNGDKAALARIASSAYIIPGGDNDDDDDDVHHGGVRSQRLQGRSAPLRQRFSRTRFAAC